MKITKAHLIGIIFSLAILLVDIIFFIGEKIFFFLIGIALVVVALPFVIGVGLESKTEKEKNEMFLEFTRNLAESVKAGTPIGQSILNMRAKDFGYLSPHINKLANQMSLGIPLGRAFENFAGDVGSDTVKRAISLIREAEAAGGQIQNILDSVANAMYQIEKLKKERKAAIYNLVVQGYIIFFIFIGIMLVMQYKILPLTAGVGSIANIGSGANIGGLPTVGGAAVNAEQLARPFLYMLLIQGVFTGLCVGKLAEGSIKDGIKHSFILSVVAFLVSSGAKAFLG